MLRRLARSLFGAGRRVAGVGSGFVDTFLRDNKVIPVVLALLALCVFAWIVAGAFLRGPDEEPVSNRDQIAQIEDPVTPDPPSPEVENPNIDSYAAYQFKDPFRQLVAPAETTSATTPTTVPAPTPSTTPTTIPTTTPTTTPQDPPENGGVVGGPDPTATGSPTAGRPSSPSTRTPTPTATGHRTARTTSSRAAEAREATAPAGVPREATVAGRGTAEGDKTCPRAGGGSRRPSRRRSPDRTPAGPRDMY